MKNFYNLAINRIEKESERIAQILPIIKKGRIVGEQKFKWKEIILRSKEIQLYIGRKSFVKRIGIFLPNNEHYLPTFLASLALNLEIISINPFLTLEELNKIIKINKIGYVLTDSKTIKRLRKINRGDIILVDKIRHKEEHFKKIYSNTKLKDIIVISPTSGTSGSSKWVGLSNKNIIWASNKYKEIYKMNKKSIIIAALPFYYNYGMFANLTSSILSGSSIILLQKWNPKIVVQAIKRYKVNIFSGSPFMYLDIIPKIKNNRDLKSLEICDVGGTPMPIEKIKEFEIKSGAIITEGYGLTETTSLTHFNPHAKDREIGSIGKKIKGCQCKILSVENRPVKRGDWGVLWVKGPMIASKYVYPKEENIRRFKNGWFNTEDVVKVDKNNFYFLMGRLSDLNSVPQQIFPRTIEEKLYKFKGVKECAVIFGKLEHEKIKNYEIYVVLRNSAIKNQFFKFIKSDLGDLPIQKVKILKKMPKTYTGKIKKSNL